MTEEEPGEPQRRWRRWGGVHEKVGEGNNCGQRGSGEEKEKMLHVVVVVVFFKEDFSVNIVNIPGFILFNY